MPTVKELFDRIYTQASEIIGGLAES
jgi:hypothetical protein